MSLLVFVALAHAAPLAGALWRRVREACSRLQELRVRRVQRANVAPPPRPVLPPVEEPDELMSIPRLLLQALSDLPSATTTNAEMPAFDELIDRSQDDEAVWVEVIASIAPTLPLANPLSCALISILLDAFPLPAKSAVVDVARHLAHQAGTCSTAAEKRNVLIVIAVLAEKFAGRFSELLLSDAMLHALLGYLERDESPTTTLYCLLAFEKFAQTGKNKERLLQLGLPARLYRVEQRYCGADSSGPVSFQSGERSKRLALVLRKAEVGFCAMWTLDNVFPCEGRVYTVDRTDVSQVNVMLDVRDATKFLKLAPNGLEARNDAPSFESVRATCCASESGLWYYETTIFTGGIMQVGWCTKDCAYQSDDGIGIGDDRHSFSYDGCRRLVWHNQGTRGFQGLPKWRAGDTLGFLLDLDAREAHFSANGVWLMRVPLPCWHPEGLYPAASLMTFQHLRFNFGNEPYRFPPAIEFQSLNGIGRMTAEQKTITPRLLTLSRLQAEEHDDDPDRPVCQICFDSPPTAVLRPCNHAEFCLECAQHCKRCPMCRTPIVAREPVVLAAPTSDTGPDSNNDDPETII